MKKTVISLFVGFMLILTAGCNREKPILITHSEPITKKNITNPVRIFKPQQRIYFAILVPKGFSDSVIRIQIMKKDERTSYWGYSIQQTLDINVEVQKKFHLGYTTVGQKGYYIMRIFEIKNKDKEIAKTDFWIKE